MVITMKTLGSQSAKLVQTLHDERKSIFTIKDAARILQSPKNVVSNMLGKAQQRGIVTRLQRGLYTLVPAELGSETVYAGDPLVVADHLPGERLHYLSHGTALAIHGMTLQPRIVVTVSAVGSPSRTINVQGTEIRIVNIRESQVFGIEKHWVDPGVSVQVSDVERTIIDCLRRPDLCGGYAEADVGTWIVRDRVRTQTLVDYALRLNVGAVIRRLGYLLDSCQIGTEDDRARLTEKLSATYHPLDPSLPADGPHSAKWRLRLNVSREELEAQRGS
ncbi:transcriptional regulator [Bradyrhizobium centrolobii]|uniref:Transcriptional regulator n=2 Tax=Bradyrhizobium centrolobii TaxID=1505087 RepID=A0A176YPM1_9BRAD|nr:transcriptional regulator [Bradyrhizobium centrolobii]